ncbi:MAG: ABC transporter ATP-binding protein [Desulfurococcales archaeon ex4484_217_1]|nr:MAG: ABC transporter ATP-binding protein [Desulfurococcales archaeon ex4484_217_1]
MLNISKIYPDGVVALRDVNLTVYEGEIHGLLGENGAGKTTLMRILYGEIKPTKGKIRLFGRKVSFHGPWDAIRHGIGMVYQHFTLVPTFTVLENLHLSFTSVEKKMSESMIRRNAEKLMKEIGFEVPLDAIVEDLPIGVQQRAEILKILLRKAKILILDEPTSVLTPIETRELFKTLKKLKEKGITIIFITHKLREVKEITDRVTVLRKGRLVGTVETANVSEIDLARMMVGREVFLKISKKPAKVGRKVLETVNLWVKDDRGLDAVRGVSLDLYEGEILGIAGVQGNGQKELVEAIAGIRPIIKGRIIVDNVDVTNKSTVERYRLGLAYVPDSRLVGLVFDMSLVENTTLTNLHKVLTKTKRILWDKASEIAVKVVKELDIIAPSLGAPVKYLSGGNQQKVMVGREIVREPKIFIVAEPTHGLDVGATEFIRKTLISLRDKDKAILLVSTDLDEIMQLSDRIAVMYEGKIVAIGKAEEFSVERLGLLMGGVKA